MSRQDFSCGRLCFELRVPAIVFLNARGPLMIARDASERMAVVTGDSTTLQHMTIQSSQVGTPWLDRIVSVQKNASSGSLPGFEA